MYIRTNIVLDDKLIREAFRYAHVTTKRDLIDLALREFVATHKGKDLRHLRGRISIRDDYDYKALRKDTK